MINKPKCFIKLHGKKLIDWQLETLKNAGIEDIALVRGYKKNVFKYNLKYFDNVKWSETNMVTSLLSANSWLKLHTCIISYSDIIYSPDAVSRLKTIKNDIGITYDKNWSILWSKRFDDPLIDAETFRIDKKNFLIEIGNKPKTLEEVQGQFMGLLKINPNGWDKICKLLNRYTEKEKSNMDITNLLKKLIYFGTKVETISIKDSWYEVDSKSDLEYYSSIEKLWDD